MEKDPLKQNIRYLKGVGEKRAACYARLGITDVYSLLRHYPRSYIDYSAPVGIMEAVPGETQVIRARVFKKGREQRIRKGLSVFKIFVTDNAADMTITIFNSRFLADALKEGESYYFYGKVTGNLLRKEMNSPQVLRVIHGAVMQPVYPLTDGLTNKMISGNMEQALQLLNSGRGDSLPSVIREQYRLCGIVEALRNIHFPSSAAAQQKAKRRLAFEELLTLQLGMSQLKLRNRKSTSILISKPDLKPFLSSLPFELTNAQRRCIEDGLTDFQSGIPMNRLLQGDVGSGKTMVAAAMVFAAFCAGYQSVLMVPTEILAKQHYEILSKLLEPFGCKTTLLVGSMSAKQKNAARESLIRGDTFLAVGTHALLQESTEFKNLGFVVTDEQHRFGVAQRTRLAEKGERPHILVMSATPIPRTLALIIYGDLDVSVLDELPKGRKPVKTYHIDDSKRERAYRFIAKQLDEGRQAFLICPLIEENEELQLASVEEYCKKVERVYLPGYTVGILHGRQKPAEKQKVMEDFAAGRLQVLISTTVVEVGIDVPNASVMLIENAERFGLSQLHQLRGRVGRGAEQSSCILVSSHRGEENRRRLEVMCRTSDGFVIAEEDLKLRGPGDFFGERQHGLPKLKIADMVQDTRLLSEARDLAENLLKDDPLLTEPEHHGLHVLVRELFRQIPESGLH